MDPTSPHHSPTVEAPARRQMLRGAGGLLLATTLPPLGQPARAAANGDFWALARAGGHALLLRHAATEPGIGDPPGFRLEDCRTQRNLSADGRAQATRLAARFAAEGVRIDRLLSSAWCRCQDTARAFETAQRRLEVWSPLNSFFQGQGDEDRQTAAVRERLRGLRAPHTWLLVTHQVNITALTGSGVAMGEVLLVRPDGAERLSVLARWAG